MSDRIFINFTKYEYDECIRRLKSEIDTYMGSINMQHADSDYQLTPVTGSAPPSSQVTMTTTNHSRQEVLGWSEDRVKQWFTENNIDHRLVKEFYPCTGEVLKQLYDMRNDAPEFYFQSLKTNKTELKHVLEFTNLLKKLFD